LNDQCLYSLEKNNGINSWCSKAGKYLNLFSWQWNTNRSHCDLGHGFLTP
jgi:hypothetical protein